MSDLVATECAVRQLHARYADAVWRKDAEAFADCFATEGEWRISGRVFRGRGEIGTAIAGIFARMDRVLMTFQTPMVGFLAGDIAVARTYVTEQCRWQGGATNLNIGRYHDRFAPGTDGWRYAWRYFALLYQGPSDMSGTCFDAPEGIDETGMPPLDAVPPDVTGRDWSQTRG